LTRLEQLLSMVEEAALADKHAGRLVWAQQQLDLVEAVRAMIEKNKAGQRARWRKWYATKGKEARQRRKERDARADS
jgi:hypothetical protein